MADSQPELKLVDDAQERSSAVQRIYEMLRFSERLKRELRHSWLADGRRESVAEHSFQMAFMALLVAPQLDMRVNLIKVLKMVVVHDLVEAEVGDIPVTENSDRKKTKHIREFQAMRKIRHMIDGHLGKELEALWREFELSKTPEAKFVKALDNLEVQIQHNLAPLATWEEVEFGLLFSKMDPFCEHDTFLALLCEFVKAEGAKKLRAGGIDPDAYIQPAQLLTEGHS